MPAAGPHNHLFTNLNMGRGSRPFASGGAKDRGSHSGALPPRPLPARLPSGCSSAMPAPLHSLCNPSAHCSSPLRPLPARLLSAGANNTFWGVAAAGNQPVHLPPCDFGPMLNFVGTYLPPKDLGESAGGKEYELYPGYCAGRAGQNTKWRVELMRPGARIEPADLYVAMIETRQARRKANE